MRFPRPRLAFALLLLCSAVCFADAPSIPSSVDPHDGKPILRDGAPAAPSGNPSADSRPMLDLDSGHVALALASVIGLILLLRYCGKKLFPAMIAAGHGRTVRVLARCPLAPRQQVVLIQVGRRIVVAGDCGSQLTSLAQITDADEVAALLGEIQRDKSAAVATPFTSWFKSASQAFGKDEFEAEEEKAEFRSDNLDLESGDDSPLAARSELAGLSEKVRDLARQLGTNQRTG